MGYLARYTGEIRFNTPLKWGQFRHHPAAWPNDPRLDCDVRLVLDGETVETEEGTLQVKRATAVEPITDDRFKGYDMQEHLQSVVDMALAANPDIVFTGSIDAVGEDGALWRFKVVAGKAERFEPLAVWPDEAED